MELNLFENFKKHIQTNDNIKNFMDELDNFLKNSVSTSQDNIINNDTSLDPELAKNRKEGHLYLVTEDRNGEIYLWDFTDKPKHEFKEIVSSEYLLNIAKEGTLLQYKNGKYELYSENGYDMLFDENSNQKK